MPVFITLGVFGLILVISGIVIFGSSRQTSEGSMYDTESVVSPEERNAEIKRYEKILRRNPKNVYANNELALLLSESQPDKAIDYINKAIVLAPDIPLYHVNKSLIITKNNGDPLAAIKSIDRAIKLAPQRSEYYLIKARIMEKSGRIDEAVKFYKKVIGLDEKNAGACYSLACLIFDTDPRTAYQCLSHAIDVDPQNNEYYYKKAIVLLHLGKSNMALEHLEKAIELGCQEPDAYYQLALLLKEKQPVMALNYVSKALETDPDYIPYRVLKADLYYDSGEYKEAEPIYKSISDNDLKNHYAKYKLACLHIDETKVALDYIDKAIALSHSHSHYFALRGDLYRRLERNEAATEQYRKALRLDVKNPNAQYGIAVMLAESNPSEALNHVNSALSLSPGNSHYRALKGRLLGLKGDNKGALSEFLQLIETNPENHEAYYELAMMLRHNDLDTAIENINKAVDLEPTKPLYNLLKAKLLNKRGDKHGAISVYKDVISAYPDISEAYYEISKLYVEDDIDLALQNIDNAIGIDPERDKFYALKAEFLAEHVKNNSEAIEAYNKAIEINPGVRDYYLKKAELLRLEGHLIAAYDAEDSAKKIHID